MRDVFEPGDAWFRTGDLMQRDERGYFYFVDRIGDTFRWKGENVATSEVSEAICAFPGIREATVYGVAIPDTDGRAGMAAIVIDVAHGFLDVWRYNGPQWNSRLGVLRPGSRRLSLLAAGSNRSIQREVSDVDDRNRDQRFSVLP